jgi:hypothetical protein
MSNGPTGKNWWADSRGLIVVYIVVCLAVCLQTVLLRFHIENVTHSIYYTFRGSFYDLIHNNPMYPGTSGSPYKYSPTFALFFAPFALPDPRMGVFLWSVVNVAAFITAVMALPLRRIDRVLILWVSLIDLFISVRGYQSNGLVAACIIGTVVCLEKDWPVAAAACVVAGFNIKLYGAAGGIFFLFYPNKVRFMAGGIVLTVVAFLLPLAVTSWSHLLAQYQGWYDLVKSDQDTFYKMSLMGAVQSWTGWSPPRPWTELIAMAVMVLPILRTGLFGQRVFRLRLLASFLLGLVVFNHMTEKQTFSIAVAGGALWYVLSARSWVSLGLLLFMLIGTSIGASELTPDYIQRHFLQPYNVKVVPCAVIWFVLQWELWRMGQNDRVTELRKADGINGIFEG